jgi:CRP/FNR family transcriptional regulator
MIDAQPRSASVTAARDSELSFIGRAAFEPGSRSTTRMSIGTSSRLLVRRLRDTNNVVRRDELPSLKGRVAHGLLSLAEAFGNDVGAGRILIRQKVTQSDLAAMAGIARENVSRISTTGCARNWSAGSPATTASKTAPRSNAKRRCEPRNTLEET